MTEGPRPYAASPLERVSDHWGWLMALGIITVLAGIIALALPGPTLVVIAVLFGAQLIVAGIFRFVAAFAADELTGGSRALAAVLSILSLIIGLCAIRHVLITLLALALLLGIFWIVTGAVELDMVLAQSELRSRVWTGVVGALGVLAGLIVLIYPAISLLTLAIVLGVWLIVRGVMEITLAYQAESLHHRSRAHVVPVA